MSVHNLKVIPDPGPRATILTSPTKGKPVMKGQGDADFYCGKQGCHEILLRRMDLLRMSISGIVFKCANCGSFNTG